MIPREPLLALRARQSPDAPAVACAGERLGWAALAARVDRRAAALRAAGVAPGDRVALLLGNGLAAVELAHAVEACGAALVPLHPRWTAAELLHPLRDARPRLLVHGEGPLAERAHAAAREAGVACLEAAHLDAPGRKCAAPDLAAEAPFAILYTSGTTGRPKGAVLTRANVVSAALAAVRHLGGEAGDRWLACLPLCHVGGLSILLRSVLTGAAVEVHERFESEAVARALATAEPAVTHVSFVALMLRRVLDAIQAGAAPPPAALRCVLVGGGPAPERLLARAALQGFPVAPTYGLTEAASQVATRAPGAPPGEGLRPLPGTRLRIGADGEILVQGPSVMSGYWNDPEASARALRDGWLHTGDLGELDRSGSLHVLARRSDLVVSGGENVYPAEIERVLEQHPAVAEAGVTGRPDPEFGARPEAWVVARTGANTDAVALAAFCGERLAAYKVPVAFHPVAALPRDGAGKLVRRRLGESSAGDGRRRALDQLPGSAGPASQRDAKR